jgi:hypothetical protein
MRWGPERMGVSGYGPRGSEFRPELSGAGAAFSTRGDIRHQGTADILDTP